MLNSGIVSRMIQAIDKRRRIRMPIAASKPVRRARSCWARGNLPDRMEMKMTLSTPRMTSRKVSVTRASRPSELNNASMAAHVTMCAGASSVRE